jgi:PAS domain S-box-containing protein
MASRKAFDPVKSTRSIDPAIRFAQRYKAFFDSTHDALAVFGPDGSILDANPRLIRLLNYSYERLVDSKLAGLVAAEHFDEVWIRFRTTLEGRRKTPMECELVAQSGKRRPVEIDFSLLKNQYGFPKTILAVMHNLAQRKEMETRLIERAERLQRVLDATPTVLLVLDERKRIQSINRSGLERLSRAESSVIGKRIGEYLGCVKREESVRGCGFGHFCRDCVIRLSLARCLATGERVLRAEESIVQDHIQNPPLYFRINVVPLEFHAKRWAVVSLEDLTGIKKAESHTMQLHNSIMRANLELKRALDQFARTQSQLLESQKLEQIGMLASGFTHNLRTPLAGIKGYAQLLQMDHPEFTELDAILHETDVMEDIIGNLMLKSRKDHEDRQEPINLNALLKIEMKFLSANLFMRHHVRVVTDWDPELPTLAGVHVHFSQIFSNLIQNSLDAMFQSPQKELTLRTLHDDENVVVEVSDTGCGISPENQGRIFDAFFTTKPTILERKGDEPVGTGLGLPSVNNFLRLYGGRIQFQSEPGRGTTVTVRFPRFHGESAGLPRVLVVDDEDNIVNLLIKICQDMGLEAYGSTDGTRALKLFQNLSPAVVVTDLCMPGLTGCELLTEIRRIRPQQKVIYVSGYLENPDFKQWLDQELTHPELCVLLKKPFPMERFKSLLTNMLAS